MLGEKKQRKWKLAEIGQWLKNAFLAMIKGEFLLRLHVSKYFIHIIYTFFLFWVSIWLSLKIQDIEIYHAQKTVELAGMGRMSKIEDMLREKGSTLSIPEKPADRI